MSGLYYRLSQTEDPEERLEDACLWKAIHDTWGAGVTLLPRGTKTPEGATLIGRPQHFEDTQHFLGKTQCSYWRDPAFLQHLNREFQLMDLDAAAAAVSKAHSIGKSLFVKATDHKSFVQAVPPGAGLYEVMDDWAMSFMDRPPCLMVQEFTPMSHERRFVVIGRQIVTSSPVAWHLTPLSRYEMARQGEVNHLHAPSPKSSSLISDPGLYNQMRDLVERVIGQTQEPHLIVDVARLDDGRIELIEFNGCAPGLFGLYACDPYAIARDMLQLAPEALRQEVLHRQQSGVEWPLSVPPAPPEPKYGELTSLEL